MILDKKRTTEVIIKAWIDEAEAVVIGAGAGLSASAGIVYNGARFEVNFKRFIERYGMKDMYSAGFYPFKTLEEKWGYWSRHVLLNRFEVGALPLYRKLLTLVEDKNYFVITTNVDHQFLLAGFDNKRLFAPQGDYGLFQCAAACHDTLYDNEAIIRKMVSQEYDCLIPSELIPRCPVCGGEMELNLRKDNFFVEDAHWHEAADRYTSFLETHENKKILFIELGVGMNTPIIIKYPFWQMTMKWKNAKYICINREEAYAPKQIEESSLCIGRDIGEILFQLEA